MVLGLDWADEQQREIEGQKKMKDDVCGGIWKGQWTEASK
jgi:hypothetical protein